MLLKKNYLLVPAAMLLYVTACGSAAKLASHAGQNGAAAGTEAGSPSGVQTGGSVALTEPATTSDPTVSKIHIMVLDEAACAQGAGSGQPASGDNPGPGNSPDRSGRHHPRMPPPPPPPPQDKDMDGRGRWNYGGQNQGAPIPNNQASASTPVPSASPAASMPNVSAPLVSPAPAANQCVVKDVSQDYQAGAQLTVDGIPDGSYTLDVVLEDANGNSREEGTAQVTVTTGQVAAADVSLAPVKQGSVAVTIHEAATKLAITSAALVQTTAGCGAVQIEAQDVNGNATAGAAAVNLALSSSSSTGAFYSDSTCSTAAQAATIAATTAAVTVYYKDSTAGTATLSVADQAASGLTASTALATIQAP